MSLTEARLAAIKMPEYPNSRDAESAALSGGKEMAYLLGRVEHLLSDEAKKLLTHPHKMRDELLSLAAFAISGVRKAG